MLTLYRLFLILLAPLLLFISLKHYRQYKDSKYLFQRLGFKCPQLVKPIWIHCASVGEVNAALIFIESLQKKTTNTVLLTTNTITASRLAKQKLPLITHCYLPLDYSFCIRRFLNATTPERAIIVETELWPNLFAHLARSQVDISIINARLSKRTTQTNSLVLALYRQTLSHVNKILCRSSADHAAYAELGASEHQLKTIGNLKFAQTEQKTKPYDKLIPTPYVLFASSREEEERIVFSAWQKINEQKPLLVIAPRHPERRDEIVKALNLSAAYLKIRSRDETIDDQTLVYLADTIGEMPALFSHAEFVIMGGSFVPKGGHNILEPAKFGKAIIYGPYMENFDAENRLFLQHNASIQASPGKDFELKLMQLLADQPLRQATGEHARELVESYKDMADRYLAELGL